MGWTGEHHAELLHGKLGINGFFFSTRCHSHKTTNGRTSSGCIEDKASLVVIDTDVHGKEYPTTRFFGNDG